MAESTLSPIERALSAISLKSLLGGFAMYREAYVKFLKERQTFAASTILPRGPDAFSFGMVLFLYGVAVSFLLYAPLLHLNGIKPGKLFFMLQFVYVLGFSTVLVHVSARIFRGSGTLGETASVCGAWSGLTGPAYMVLNYPLWIYHPVEDFFAASRAEAVVSALPTIPAWVQVWNVAVCIALGVAAVWVMFRWIADVHRITRRRLLCALLIIYVPIGSVHQLYVTPWVSKMVRIAADVMQLF
jgi:hypothetical protein